MRKNIVVLGVAALLASAAAGCGDGDAPSTKDYEASVVDTRDRVDSALAQIGEAESQDDYLDRLDEAGELIDDAADDLDDGGAPARFEAENKMLVHNLRELSAGLRGTAAQAREFGFDELLGGAKGLNFESWNEVNADLAELREQGIRVKPLARH